MPNLLANRLQVRLEPFYLHPMTVAIIALYDAERPLVIGIAGGSGSGKTTVAQEISIE
jgi:pantothenate kinase-related protein Tda10